jgi:hypothetical protein
MDPNRFRLPTVSEVVTPQIVLLAGLQNYVISLQDNMLWSIAQPRRWSAPCCYSWHG